MIEKLKVGLIGAGMIAESAHVPALLNNKEVDFSVIIDSNPERAKSLNKKFGINVPYIASLDELNVKIDAVVICTPNDSHKDICMKCFDRGIHVLVEKPLANSYKDSVEIIAKAKENKCVLVVGYCTRFWPSVQYVKDLVEGRVLGEIKRFVFQYGAAGGWAPYSNYILSKEKSGGGAFIINASHYLDRMLWYFGTPDEYTFFDDAQGGLEANALAEFEYSKVRKFNGIIRVSKTVNLDSGCFIEFEKGLVSLRDWKSPLLGIEFSNKYKDVKFSVDTAGFTLNTRPDMYASQLGEFYTLIKNKDYLGKSNLDDALKNVEITERLYEMKQVLNCDWYNK